MTLQTEFTFTLPKGYVDDHGTLHREGVMRLATARDEIDPLRDARVRENDSYLTIILLAKVVTRLGSLPMVTASTIENLFVADLSYLQDFYRIVNFGDHSMLEALERGEGAGMELGLGRPLEVVASGGA